MNRKKIALLLTGLFITSGLLMGCNSSDNTSINDGSSVRQTSERTVREFKGNGFPDVPSADVRNYDPTPETPTALEQNGMDNDRSFNRESMDKNFAEEKYSDINRVSNDVQADNFINNSKQNRSMVSENVNEMISSDINQIESISESLTEKNQVLGNSSLYSSSSSRANQNVGTITIVKSSGGTHIPPESVLTNGGRVQGTVEISFKLPQEVISANGLGDLIMNAYQEAREDANLGYKGDKLQERQKLAAKLAEVFKPSDGLNLSFQSDKGPQNVPLKSSNMFPSNNMVGDLNTQYYLKNMIDLDYGVNNGVSKSPENIAIKMIIRDVSPSGSKGLYTDTNYRYLGIKNGEKLKVTLGSEQGELSGFNIPDFKTGKQSSNIKATTASKSVVFDYKDSGFNGSTGKEIGAFFEQLRDSVYIDLPSIIKASTTTPNVSPQEIETTGTSIKFKTILVDDKDKTITSIKFTDDKNKTYETKLIPVDSSKTNGECYLEVVGLQRDMDYVFKNMTITSNINGTMKTKTIRFAEYTKTGNPQEVVDNTLPIRTARFVGPKINLTKDDVTLPGGIKVPSVKNDSTALRYVVKVDNPEGFVGDMTVGGLGNNERAKVEKIVDKDARVNYYVVTIYNLMPNTNYDFLNLQLSYVDPNGNKNETIQRLQEINKVDDTSLNTKTDNKTEEKALAGTERFNVIINDEVKSENPRQVEIPVFIDDIQGSFLRTEFKSTNNGTNQVKFKFEDNKLKFSNLEPDFNFVYNVGFVYQDEQGNRKVLDKFVKVSTPKALDFDIKSLKVTVKDLVAEVQFELYSQAKSKIRSVTVKDEFGQEIKGVWDNSTNTLKLEGLKSDTDYKNVEVSLTLENGTIVKHTLDSFTTKVETPENKPTGKVAEFVQRVYKIALGREPEVEGWNFWIDKLQKKEITATEFIAENLMTQKEFVERQLSKSEFVTIMYSLIVNREPDSEGQKYWERKYDEYKSQTNSIAELRIKIAREMMDQPEFKELVTNLNLRY